MFGRSGGASPIATHTTGPDQNLSSSRPIRYVHHRPWPSGRRDERTERTTSQDSKGRTNGVTNQEPTNQPTNQPTGAVGSRRRILAGLIETLWAKLREENNAPLSMLRRAGRERREMKCTSRGAGSEHELVSVRQCSVYGPSIYPSTYCRDRDRRAPRARGWTRTRTREGHHRLPQLH